jgi:hypothetical protein
MEKAVRIIYYQPSDELNILVGEPQDSVLLEIDDEVYVRLHPETEEVLGLTILNFEERTKGQGQELPVLAHFALPISASIAPYAQSARTSIHESSPPYNPEGDEHEQN